MRSDSRVKLVDFRVSHGPTFDVGANVGDLTAAMAMSHRVRCRRWICMCCVLLCLCLAGLFPPFYDGSGCLGHDGSAGSVG